VEEELYSVAQQRCRGRGWNHQQGQVRRPRIVVAVVAAGATNCAVVSIGPSAAPALALTEVARPTIGRVAIAIAGRATGSSSGITTTATLAPAL
jgi:hypothetical protein